MVKDRLLVYLSFEAYLHGAEDVWKSIWSSLRDWTKENEDSMSWGIGEKLEVVWSILVMAGHEDVHDFV